MPIILSLMIDMKSPVLCLTFCLLVLALSSIAMPKTSAFKNIETARTVNSTSSAPTVFMHAPANSFGATELIVNGGFESMVPFGWALWHLADEITVTSTDNPHSGSCHLVMGGIGLGGTGQAYAEQTFSPAVYAQTDLTLWAKGYNGLTSTLVVWIFYIGYTMTHTKAVTEDWSQITIPIDKATKVFSIRIATYDDLGNIYTATRFVDDVSMLGSSSISTTIFGEGFEGSFPEPNWNYPYDSNPNNGYDYWDDTSIRSHGGNWSAWCAEEGTQFMNYTVWSENFEGAFPTSDYQVIDFEPASGYDSWGKTDYRAYEGSWSAWCAQNGTQLFRGTQFPNSVFHKYDNDMLTNILRWADLSSYSFATFSFWYWIDSELYADGLWVYYHTSVQAGGENTMVYIDSGNSGGWKYTEINIPANAVWVAIIFWSNSVNNDFEGAYVDNIALTGSVEVPNRSIPQYDDNMQASMYRQVNLTGYSSATLSYWYWIDSEFGYDYLQVIYINSSGWFYIDLKQGNSGGWQYSEVPIPISANYVGFYFHSDHSVHNYEGAYVDDVSLSATIQPTIESCDAAGTVKDSFDVADTLYAKGSGYSPFATYNVYIVDDTAWTDGMNILSRIPGTVLSMTLDASGTIPPITFWFPPLVLGKYDIIVDVNNNSKYDVGIDALDDNDIQVTAGFQVVPEFPSLLILPLFMIATLLAVIVYKRRIH
jgi:hypothetical protein